MTDRCTAPYVESASGRDGALGSGHRAGPACDFGDFLARFTHEKDEDKDSRAGCASCGR